MTDWGAHMFDIAQWGLDMDSSGPVKITPPEDGGGSGLVYEYANGIRLLHAPEPGSQSCRFIGSEGDVWVARGQLKTNPESLKDKIIGEQEKHVYFSDNHYTDFLKAIRSRQKPICDVETGHRTASVCNLGNIAYSLKRPLAWDPVAEKFLHDKKANKRLGRSMRKEWNIL